MERSPAAYRWQGVALLRAATNPGAAELPRDLLADGTGAGGRDWLVAVWRRGEVRDALSAASPALCRQVEDVLGDDRLKERKVRRTMLSVASYLLRWQRPTPFALFAGVAPATAGSVAQVSWGSKDRLVVRADAAWLTDVILRLERCPELLERLPVVVNNAGHVRPPWPG